MIVNDRVVENIAYFQKLKRKLTSTWPMSTFVNKVMIVSDNRRSGNET